MSGFKRPERPCAICGARFQPRTDIHVTCSLACRAKLPHNTGGLRIQAGVSRRECAGCAKDFQPVKAAQRYCSAKCRKAAIRYPERPCFICDSVFAPRTPDAITCSRSCRAKLPHNTGGVRIKAGLMPRSCDQCEVSFQPVRESQRWCSLVCRTEANRERVNATRRQDYASDNPQGPRRQHACVKCGKSFSASRIDARYCSPACRKKAFTERAPRETRATGEVKKAVTVSVPSTAVRACAYCAAEFLGTRVTQRYCSDGCRLKAYKRDNPNYRTVSVSTPLLSSALPARACEWCEVEFAPARRSSTCCSKTCRIQAENLRALYRRYGLTVEDVKAKLEAQGGTCMICGEPPKPGGRTSESRLHVDHDHATGKPRDMLCSGCNKGLGLFRDNPEFLAAAALYLRRHACLP